MNFKIRVFRSYICFFRNLNFNLSLIKNVINMENFYSKFFAHKKFIKKCIKKIY